MRCKFYWVDALPNASFNRYFFQFLKKARYSDTIYPNVVKLVHTLISSYGSLIFFNIRPQFTHFKKSKKISIRWIPLCRCLIATQTEPSSLQCNVAVLQHRYMWPRAWTFSYFYVRVIGRWKKWLELAMLLTVEKYPNDQITFELRPRGDRRA